MKKIISILLTVTLFFGLCACGEKADSDLHFPEQTQNPIELLTSSSNTLQIGFSKVDLTPDSTVGLSGYSRRRALQPAVGTGCAQQRVRSFTVSH